ncbi:maltose exporter-like protein [Haematococcus lacustris]
MACASPSRTGATKPVCRPNAEIARNGMRARGQRPARATVACAQNGSWEQLTDRMVSFASVPFSILVLPQVLQNMKNMASGNSAALGCISWEGYTSALMGNTLMCSHFANRGERSAVNVQLIGIINNMMVLLQVALAEFMPTQVFAVVTVLVLVAVAMSLARLTSTSQTPTSTGSQGAAAQPSKAPQGSGLGLQQLDRWTAWQLVSGVAGLAMVPQVLYNITVPGAASFLPGCLALLIISALVALQLQRGAGHAFIQQLPGWASTLLFALSPLPQLVRNFLEPQSLQGLSVGTMLLALAGNMLMVPRALLVQDRVWLAGTSWACVAGWGQLLSMALRQSPATGAQYLHPAVFGAVSCGLGAYAMWVASNNRRGSTALSTS